MKIDQSLNAIALRPAMLALFFSLCAYILPAQPDSCWTLLLLEKSRDLKPRPDMATYSSHGFYLYRNCMYDIELNNQQRISGRLVDIRKDTLCFTNAFNQATAAIDHKVLDTIAYPISALNRLFLIADRSLGIYNKQSLNRFNFIFRKDTVHHDLPSYWVQLYSNDTARYELVPFLTMQGLDMLYEEGGRTYYYMGSGLDRLAAPKKDTTYDEKSFVWYTPNEVEKIRGLAIGLMAENMKNDELGIRDSLKIVGLNIEINPIGLMWLANGNISGPYVDSLDFYNTKVKGLYETIVNGVNLSLVGSVNEMQINGVNVGGANTVVDEINGFSVSGLNTFSYVLNGVSISAIRNRAEISKGLQVALYNKSTTLCGVQLGLWNVNGRRSLPLINWQFGPSKHSL